MGNCLSVQDAVVVDVVEVKEAEQDALEFKSRKALVDSMQHVRSKCIMYYEFTMPQAQTIIAGLRDVFACYIEQVCDFGFYVTKREINSAHQILRHFADRSDTRSIVREFCDSNKELLTHPVVAHAGPSDYWILQQCLQRAS